MDSAETVRNLLLPTEITVREKWLSAKTVPRYSASRRDCPSNLAFAETVRDLLFPTEITVREKWFPAETVLVILLPAETRQEAESRGPSLKRTAVLAGSKRSRKASEEAKYDGQSLKEAKTSEQVYTLCRLKGLHSRDKA